MFSTAPISHSRNLCRTSSGFSRMTRPVPFTWKNSDRMMASFAPIAASSESHFASRTAPVSCGVGPVERTPA